MIFIFTAIFFIPYLFSLHPTVSVGDSGELITAAYTLGIAHPPGYPLWTILGKIFTIIIPFGNIAYRVNLMSAFFGACTCAIFYFIVKKVALTEMEYGEENSKMARSISAIILCLSSTLWSQSIISEVYTLNAFFVVLIIYLLIISDAEASATYRYDASDLNRRVETRLNPRIFLVVFIYGLSLANHYIMFLFGPVFAFYLILKNPKVFNLKMILSLFIFFLPGLFLYLYLPIRSSVNPPIDWGNPENLKNFIAHIGRFQYKGLELAVKVGFATKLLFIRNFFSQLVQNFGLIAVLSIFGLISLIKKDIKFALLTVLIFLANTVGLIILLNFKFTPQDIDAFTPYYIPAWIMVALWAGYKICELRNIKFFLPVVFIVLAVQTGLTFIRTDIVILRKNFIAYDYPVNILKTVAKNSTLYLHEEVDETIFTLSYIQNVLKKRQDVAIIDSYNNIFLSKSVPEKSKKYYSAVNTAKLNRTLFLNGLLWVEQKKINSSSWDFYAIRELPRKYEYREQEVIARYSYFYGKFLIDFGDKKNGIWELKKSLKVGTELIWLHNNVGDILRQNKDYNDALHSLSNAISLDSTYAPAYYNMGLLYLEKKDDNNAIEYFQKAYQYDKTDTDSLLQLSKIYQRKGYENFVNGKIAAAITEYKKAIEYTPSSADIYYNIGVIYSQSQNNKEAKEYFLKYIQLKPGGTNAKTIKKWLTSN
ncbi:MAG: DUF2723 domain-containing protein [Elusimicrobiota bacterium]|nr:DUF2723 domain-containing protein [Elusimicrobiota bacterium]